MGVSSVNATLASLLQAQSGSSGSSSSGTSTTQSASASQRSPAYQLSLSQAATNYQVIQGLQSLQALGSEFSSTALGMATSALTNNVTSSNNNVAQVSTSTNLNYAVNVQQLAIGQTLTSGASFTSSASTIGTIGDSLVIQLGGWSGSNFTASSTDPKTISITDNSINGIVSAINGAHAGVSAALVGVTGGSYELQITGNSTGVFGGFAISGSPDLSAFEYDSTARSISLTQAAQDSSYTVNGSLFTSPTNTAVPVANGVNLDLKAVGAVSISQAQPSAQALSNINNLVGYVNSLVQGITQIKGSTLANDNSGMSTNFINALTQVGFQSLNGSNNPTTLSDIGFNVQPDGTVQFNQNTFNLAWSNDASSVAFIVSQAAIAYSSVSSHYAGAGGQIQDKINQLNQLQTAYVYGAQAAASASQGQTPQSTYSPYGQTSNPWSGTTFA